MTIGERNNILGVLIFEQRKGVAKQQNNKSWGNVIAMHLNTFSFSRGKLLFQDVNGKITVKLLEMYEMIIRHSLDLLYDLYNIMMGLWTLQYNTTLDISVGQIGIYMHKTLTFYVDF